MKNIILKLVPETQHNLLYQIGVYKITNLVTGKIYIGSTKSQGKRKPNENGFYNRFRTHLTSLKKNKHSNKHLQRSWNKYSLACWKFEVIEVCNEEMCIEREQYYLDTLLFAQEYLSKTNTKFKVKGYNICPLAQSPRTLKTNAKTVYQYTLDGHYLNQWSSLSEAGTFLKVEPRNISRACKKHLTCGGYRWRYQKFDILPVENKLFAFDLIGNLVYSCVNYDEALKFYKSKDLIANRKMIINCATRKRHCYLGYIWSKKNTLNLIDVERNAIVFKDNVFVDICYRIADVNKITGKMNIHDWSQGLHKTPFIKGIVTYGKYIIFKRFDLSISTDINFYLEHYGYATIY